MPTEPLPQITCNNCDAAISPDDARGPCCDVCEPCYAELYIVCNRCAYDTLIDESHTPECGYFMHRPLCESCYDERYSRCEACDDETTSDDIRDGYCSSCWDEYYCSCEDCGCTMSRDDANVTNGDYYCDGCNNENEWNPVPIHLDDDAPYAEIGSRRKFGIELETSSCPDHHQLNGETVFGCKEDGSITGMEFISPPMASDRGLNAIRRFCDEAAGLGFKVDNHCGYHLHIDMKRTSSDQRKRVAAAYAITAKVWQSFVPASRRDNSYCGALGWGWREVMRADNFDTFASEFSRYVWFNLYSIHRHSTFEIRLHTGTLNADKIINWVKAHLRFVDTIIGMGDEEIEQWAKLGPARLRELVETTWGDNELVEFYRNRARKFSDETLLPGAIKLETADV